MLSGVLSGVWSGVWSGSAEELDVLNGDGQESGTGRNSGDDGSQAQGNQNLKRKIFIINSS